MERILVPLDGSSLAEAVLPLAESLALSRNAELILLLAVAGSAPGVRMEEAGGAKEYLRDLSDRLREKGLSVRWELWYEEPLKAITKAVERGGAELIVMATHGRRGLSRWLLGSLAADVVRSALIPVLLVRGRLEWKPGLRRKILIPLDGSEVSEAILPVVERLAIPTDSTLDLLEVIEPLPSAAQEVSPFRVDEIFALRREDAMRYLSKVAEPLRVDGFHVEPLVRIGGVAETILDVARQEAADLIAMVTHRRAGLERLFFGSVAEAVLSRSSLPVLLLKCEEE